MLNDKLAIQDHRTANNPDRVHIVGTVIEMALILVIVILFNVFPDRIGFAQSLTDPSSFKPLLAPEFQDHMPWLNLYWGLALSLCAINLAFGRWNVYSRLAEIGLTVLAVYILLRMVLGGPLFVYPGLTLVVKFALLVALCAACVGTIVKFVQLLNRMQAAAPPEQSQRSPDR